MSSTFRYVRTSIREVPRHIVDALTGLQNSPFTVVAEDQATGWYVLHYQDPDGQQHNNAYIAIGPARYRATARYYVTNQSYVDVATVVVMMFREQDIDPGTWTANELPRVAFFLYFRIIPYVTSVTVNRDVNYVCFDQQPATDWSIFTSFVDDVYLYADRYGFVIAVQPGYDQYRTGTPMLTYFRRGTPLNRNLTLTDWWVLFQDGMRIVFQAAVFSTTYATRYADVHDIYLNPFPGTWCGTIPGDSPNDLLGQVVNLGVQRQVVPFHGFVTYNYRETIENCYWRPQNRSTWSWKSYYLQVAYREWPNSGAGGVAWRGAVFVPPTTRSIIDGNAYIYFIPLFHEHNESYGSTMYNVPRATFTVIDIAPVERNEAQLFMGDIVQLPDGKQYIMVELTDPAQNPGIFYYEPDYPNAHYGCSYCSPRLLGYISNLPRNWALRYLMPYAL